MSDLMEEYASITEDYVDVWSRLYDILERDLTYQRNLLKSGGSKEYMAVVKDNILRLTRIKEVTQANLNTAVLGAKTIETIRKEDISE